MNVEKSGPDFAIPVILVIGHLERKRLKNQVSSLPFGDTEK
jgi:hypothetical protein